jgi:hypothetical protein
MIAAFDNGDELVHPCSRRHETSLESKATIRDRRRMILTTMRGTFGQWKAESPSGVTKVFSNEQETILKQDLRRAAMAG